MKKLLPLLLFLIPQFAFAAFSIPLTGTTTTGTIFAFPTAVNGTYPYLMSPIFYATSTTLASRFPFASTTQLSATSLCLSADCRTVWPSSTGGSGNVATSSAETTTRVPFWTSTNATPALLSGGSSGFTFNNTGTLLTITNASTSNLTASNFWLIGQSAGCAQFDANAKLTSTGTNCGGSDPFTHQSYNGQTTSATTSTLWLTNTGFPSLAASSTFFTQASTTLFTNSGNTYLTGLTSKLLGTDNTGLVVGTTSVGTNYLTGPLGTINTNAPLGGGGSFSVGGTLTLTCATCVTSQFAWPWNILTTFGTTTNATTTPSWFQTAFYASSSPSVPDRIDNFIANTSTTTNATTTTFGFTGLTNAILSTNQAGVVVATTSIGTNYLTGPLFTVTTASPLGGAATISVGGTLALTCATCNTYGWPWNVITNFGTTTDATTTALQVPVLFASSTTATSTFGGSLVLSSASNVPNVRIGSTTPPYGYTRNDVFSIIDSINDYTDANITNTSNGPCATSDLVTQNNNATAASFFGDLGHTSSGFTGAGCTNNPFTGFGTSSSFLFDPDGNLNFALGSSTNPAQKMQWFTQGYAATNLRMSLNNVGLLNMFAGASTTQMSVQGGSLWIGGTATSTLVGNNGTSTLASNLTVGTTTETIAGSTIQNGAALYISNAINSLGGIIMRTWTNVTNAISVINAAGITVFNIDDTNTTGAKFSVGSSTPVADLTVQANNGDTNLQLFNVASSTATATTTAFLITNTGHIIASSTNPVLTSCGTGPTMVGDDTHGQITVGSAATGCTLTFQQPWSAAPTCIVSEQTVSLTNTLGYTISSTALTLSETGLAGVKINYICEGMSGTQ